MEEKSGKLKTDLKSVVSPKLLPHLILVLSPIQTNVLNGTAIAVNVMELNVELVIASQHQILMENVNLSVEQDLACVKLVILLINLNVENVNKGLY